jgi:hypothetical protein
MTSIIDESIRTLSIIVNVTTGLAHPNDKNKALELFSILHRNGVILLKAEVENAAIAQGWNSKNADELGSLAQQIGEGKTAMVSGGPWLSPDIYDQIKSRIV